MENIVTRVQFGVKSFKEPTVMLDISFLRLSVLQSYAIASIIFGLSVLDAISIYLGIGLPTNAILFLITVVLLSAS
jgi:hypothetical protein